jgi:hypothetical protein
MKQWVENSHEDQVVRFSLRGFELALVFAAVEIATGGISAVAALGC